MPHLAPHKSVRQDLRNFGNPLLRAHQFRIKWVTHIASFPAFSIRASKKDLKTTYRLYTGERAKVSEIFSSERAFFNIWFTRQRDIPAIEYRSLLENRGLHGLHTGSESKESGVFEKW
jgi:hypothetical protein